MTLALLLALSALAGPASALPARASPVRVDAEPVRYIYPKRQVVFTGKPVRLTRDDAVLTCRRLVADNDDAGRIVRAVCAGDVKLTRGTRVITCQTATFENAESRVVCVGDPVMRDGAAEARGERLTYDLGSDEVTFDKVTITAPGEEVDARQKEYEARRKPGAQGEKPRDEKPREERR